MADNIYIYHTSPNQKSVITKKTVSDAGSPYGICNVSAVLTAASTLSDRAFKLYMRMNLHQDGFTYALSPVEISKSTGMSDKRYRDAVKELVEKGYLVQSEKYNSLFTFYEYPQQDNRQCTGRQASPDDLTETDGSCVPNGRMTRPNREDNPSISGGQILHDITSHTTNDSTENNTYMGRSFEDDYNRYLLDKEEKRKGDLASPVFSCYDEDDAIMYEDAESSIRRDYDLDDELPF